MPALQQMAYQDRLQKRVTTARDGNHWATGGGTQDFISQQFDARLGGLPPK